jgi:hypothetical protein
MTNLIVFAQAEPATNVLEAGKKAMEAGKEMGQQVVGTGQETWDQVTTQVTHLVGSYLPNVLAALGVLIVGWLVALIVAGAVGIVLRRLKPFARVSKSIAGEGAPEAPDVSPRVAKGVFYLLMLFVLVAFFQTLGLTIVTEPLNAFLKQVFTYAPRIIAASVLLFAAWMVATGVRFVIRKVLTAAKMDKRLTREAGVEGDSDLPLTRTISEASYWLIYLLFLPAVLDALAVPGLLAPVQDMVQQILGFLPNLFGAAVILGIGWFVARIVQRVVTNLLAAAGADRLSERVGLATLIGDNKLSGVLGLGVYILILVPVIVGSLNALKIEAVTTPASQMLNTIVGALPGIFAAVLVVGVAYVVGRVVSELAANLLQGLGFDKLPARLGLAREPIAGRRTPSQIAGTIILVAVVLFATMQALPMLGFDLLAGMMSQFLTFATSVLVGLVIFGFGLFFAKLLAELIRDSSIANASLLATLARVSILILAGAMGLQQMGLAQEIVNLAFGITLGAVAVAAAIAFGFGGRDAAKRLVDEFTEHGVRETISSL